MRRNFKVRVASGNERSMMLYRRENKKNTGVAMIKSFGTTSGVSATKKLQRIRRHSGVSAPSAFVKPKVT